MARGSWTSGLRLWAGATVAVTSLTGVAGCAAGTPKATAPAAAPPTPIARLNTAQLVLHRIPFCDLVPRSAITDALGRRPTSHASWGNGDSSAFVGGPGDRSQEFGCRFSAGSAVAEAWVFASPVRPSLAEQVVRDATHEKGCRDALAPSFGSPSVEQLCRQDGDVVRVRHAGLFGATWLTCQVSASLPGGQVGRRADAWCVQVANALNTAH